MQDKYNIGPVTIVQLVGLSAKPRIASVQTDVAARAADPIPMSAAAGFGDDVSQPVADLDISFQTVKAAPALGLSADPARGHISIEAGVDRPVVDANAPVSTIDPSTFDKTPPDGSLPDPSIGPRDENRLPDGTPPSVPNAMVDIPAEADVTAPPMGAVFDGIEAFGDDHILDFSIAPDVGGLTIDASTSATHKSKSRDYYHWAWLEAENGHYSTLSGRYFITEDLYLKLNNNAQPNVDVSFAQGLLGANVIVSKLGNIIKSSKIDPQMLDYL